MVLEGDAREDLGRRLGNGQTRMGRWSRVGTARDSTIGRGEDKGVSVLNSYRWRSGQRKETQPRGE